MPSKLLAFTLLVFFSIPMVLIGFLVIITSKGDAIHWSRRIGINNKEFLMPKFRTMLKETPLVASSLLETPNSFLSPIGSILRRFSLDELPQLFSIIKGDMNFIGPRPALFNQNDLIFLRSEHGVDKLVPGITGWAQINGRNNLSIQEKVLLDAYYLKQKSFKLNTKIIWLTISKVLRSDGVAH